MEDYEKYFKRENETSLYEGRPAADVNYVLKVVTDPNSPELSEEPIVAARPKPRATLKKETLSVHRRADELAANAAQ